MSGGADFLQSLGWAVLNSLWQLALLWIAYQLITGIFKKLSSSAKSSLASTLLIGGFGWFIYTFFSVYGAGTTSEVIASSAIVNSEMNPELNNWLQRSLPVASVVYLLLLIFPALHFIRNYRYVQVIRKYGLSKIDATWRLFVSNTAAHMGIRRKVSVWISDLVSSPVTIGFLKPVILVPLAAINHLTPQQIEAVLLHELSHIRRFDYLLNLVLHFVQTILYFNPFAKAFVKIVAKEREKSCDELVLQFQYDGHEYATALLTLERAGQTSQVFTMAAGGRKADLLSRVESILGVKKKQSFSFNRLAGFMAGFLCIIALNAILIITRPANAHKASDFASLRNAGDIFRQTGEAAGDIVLSDTETPSETVATVVNHFQRDSEEVAVASPAKHEETFVSPAGFMSYAFENPVMSASFIQEIAPDLTEKQMQKVEAALNASKKVLTTTQWKLVESKLADVFTEKEKAELKGLYAKEIEKADWKALEGKLAQAYNTIEWEKVNMQLEQAVNEIRLDSLQQVYYEAIDKICDVQHEMQLQNIESIPDTEYDINVLETKKTELRRELNRVKTARIKKIVHL